MTMGGSFATSPDIFAVNLNTFLLEGMKVGRDQSPILQFRIPRILENTQCNQILVWQDVHKNKLSFLIQHTEMEFTILLYGD